MKTRLALLALLSLVAACNAQPQSLPVKSLTIQTAAAGETTALQTEIADDEQERATGLMYRKQMCANCAMLFIWPSPKPIAMWMKNTYIPLDMLFIREGKIVHIAPAIPHDLTAVTAGVEVDMVLETNSGWAERNKVQPGDTLTLF